MPPTSNHLDVAREALERTIRELRGADQAGRAGPGRPRWQSQSPRPWPSAWKRDKKVLRVLRARPARRRKRRGGTRADQAVKLIEGQPGISASDVAKTMKIKPNYLYRVLGDLEKEGRVKKDGRQYYPGG